MVWRWCGAPPAAKRRTGTAAEPPAASPTQQAAAPLRWQPPQPQAAAPSTSTAPASLQPGRDTSRICFAHKPKAIVPAAGGTPHAPPTGRWIGGGSPPAAHGATQNYSSTTGSGGYAAAMAPAAPDTDGERQAAFDWETEEGLRWMREDAQFLAGQLSTAQQNLEAAQKEAARWRSALQELGDAPDPLPRLQHNKRAPLFPDQQATEQRGHSAAAGGCSGGAQPAARRPEGSAEVLGGGRLVQYGGAVSYSIMDLSTLNWCRPEMAD